MRASGSRNLRIHLHRMCPKAGSPNVKIDIEGSECKQIQRLSELITRNGSQGYFSPLDPESGLCQC